MRQVEQDVRVAHENFLTSGRRVQELEAQVAAARESLRQAEQSYQVGLATNLERVTSQDAVLSAELQLVSAQFDRKLSYLELQRAVGSLRP